MILAEAIAVLELVRGCGWNLAIDVAIGACRFVSLIRRLVNCPRSVSVPLTLTSPLRVLILQP